MASILKPKSFFGSKPSVDSQPSTGTVAPGGATENTGVPSSTASEHRSLDSVTAQARAILQQCQIDCEQLREKARKEAIEEGRAVIDQLAHQQAEALVGQKMADVVARVDAICNAMESATQQWLRQWQHETVSLAIKIAEKLLVRQIESDPTILLTWIEEMVRLVQSQRHLTIKLNTADALKLSEALPSLIERVSPGIDFEVVDDPGLEPCSVLIQTPNTTLDRSLKMQLERLQQELA